MASNQNEGKHPSHYEIRINGKKFDSEERLLNGSQILKLAGLEPPENYELLIKIQKQEFEPVQLNEQVDLAQEGIEEFEANPIKNITIFLDDEPHQGITKCFMTPVEVLALDNKSKDLYYLKQILHNKEISYKNDEDYKIAIVDKMRFSTCKKDATGVS